MTILPEFPLRNGEQHRNLCERYRALITNKQRKQLFAKYGVRWTEFARLKYFDLVKYTVVDPMHTLLLGMWCRCIRLDELTQVLGVAKTQWYTEWIKQGTLRANTTKTVRELNVIHEFLESVRNIQRQHPTNPDVLKVRVPFVGGSSSATSG
jgi:hypothetical protein